MVDLNVNRWLEQRLIVCRIFYFNGALIDLIEGRRRQGFPTQGMAALEINDRGGTLYNSEGCEAENLLMTCYYITDLCCFC
jgi:hypothetical protein